MFCRLCSKGVAKMFSHSYRDLSSIHCDTFHALCREVCEQLLQSHPSIEFRSNTSFAICNHWPSHPGSHSPSNLLYKISILVILLLCGVLSAFSNSHPHSYRFIQYPTSMIRDELRQVKFPLIFLLLC